MNNMAKGLGVVIAGIVISAVGAFIAGFSAKAAYDDYKKLEKFKSGHIVLNDSNKFNLEVDAGVVNVHHSTTTESYVDYNVLEFYDVKYDSEDNELKLKRKWQYWFIWFSNNKSVMDVYLTEKDYETFIDLNAGVINVIGDYNFSSLTIDVSAGSLNIKDNINADKLDIRLSAGDVNLAGDVKVTNDAKVKVSAGDVDINYLEAKTIETRISAGDIKCKVKSDDILFKISAGDLTMDIVGEKLDYTIKIKKSAGSCNIKDNEGGSKKLDGNISAGKATINFVD